MYSELSASDAAELSIFEVPASGASVDAPADGKAGEPCDKTEVDGDATSTATPLLVPLYGPVDVMDSIAAKMVFSLCASVFPHPLLLAQQLLGIEDQDFAEFTVNVSDTGNNCMDLVAAYLTNLRVVQSDEPDTPVTPGLIPARHAATVASVAAKARELLNELALARASVKPRKAPKNKAAEMSARMAAASAPSSTDGLTETGSVADRPGSGEEGSGSACGSDDDDEDIALSSSSGHQDTSREGSSPRTSREDEERLLYALQGPRAAEETLKLTRRRPTGSKSSSSSDLRPGADTSRGSKQEHSVPAAPASATNNNNSGGAHNSPKPQPNPAPSRGGKGNSAFSAAGQQAAASGGGRQANGRGGGHHAQQQQQGSAASQLHAAMSCPPFGLPPAHEGTGGQQQQGGSHQQHRRNANGRASNGAGGNGMTRMPMRNSATHHQPPPLQQQVAPASLQLAQQLLSLQQQQHELGALNHFSASLLSGAYGNAGALQAAAGQQQLNSLNAASAALEQLAAAQAMNVAGANMHSVLGGHHHQPGVHQGHSALLGGYGNNPGAAAHMAGHVTGLGATAGMNGASMLQQAANALLQQHVGMGSMGSGMLVKQQQVGGDAWGSMALHYAQLANSMA